jgi:sugar transferase (PEP-CTERM/EpsH1 system associated)
MGAMPAAAAPLVMHVVHRLDFGGLENGLVNLINRMEPSRYRHAVVCLTDYSDFAKRIQRPAVPLIALNKQPGKDPGCYWRLGRTIRRLKPAVVHTRNLGTLDMQFVAALCAVRGRVHGEHGWDVYDLHGKHPRYLRMRRVARHFVKRYVAMSRDLAQWLQGSVGVPAARITQIYSGVDTERFRPRHDSDRPVWPAGFAPADAIVIGTVGRQEQVKNPLALVRAFGQLVDAVPDLAARLRLVLVGGGPLFEQLGRQVAELGLAAQVWLPGPRHDVNEILRQFDVFVLPSLNEGVSNTILEAMACAVPVVASRVGGTPEVVRDGQTGLLYSAQDETQLTLRLRAYVEDAALRQEHGRQARAIVEQHHSLESMVRSYLEVYDAVLK